MELKEKAVKGVAWSTVDKWGTQAITFVVFLLLARLLEPEAFGLVAQATVFIAFVQLFLDQGMSQALIQFPKLERKHLDTGFWIAILTSIIMTTAGILSSDLIANFFNESQLAPVVAWLSVSFVFFAFSSTQQAILQRKLDFKSLALRSLFAKTIAGFIGVGLAFYGYGVWSLVVQNLANGFFGAVFLWKVSDWRPSLNFSRPVFRELFGFGANTMGVRVLNFFDIRFDDLLIGYFLGATILGYYAVAYRLLRTVIDVLTGISISVVFPAFSRLQDQPDKLRRAFYRITQLTNLLVWPSFLGMVVIAPEIVRTVFGVKWMPSVPVMQLLAVGGALFSTVQFGGSVAWALGKPNYVLIARILVTMIRIAVYLLVVQWGIVAVAAAYLSVTYAVLAPTYIWIVHRLIHIDFKIYLNLYKSSLVGSLLMVVVVLLVKNALGDSLGANLALLLYISVGGLTYLLAIRLIFPVLFRDMINFIRPILPLQGAR